MELNTIYNENCVKTMARMPDGFVNLTVTSPPYDNIRKYQDTTSEIDQLLAEYNLYRETTDRMESFRQLSRLDGVQQRQDFVNFLAAIMDKRKEKRTDKMENGK